MLSDDIRMALLADADRKTRVRKNSKGEEVVAFRCPKHDDERPSAYMSGGSWYCKRCGIAEPITNLAPLVGVTLQSKNGQQGRPQGLGNIIAEYDYVDEQGEPLFQAVRLDPKDFRIRHRNGKGGWTWGLGGARLVPYRLPDVLAAIAAGRTIYVCEGEKDCDALAAAGLTATTNAMGAGKWKAEYVEALRGARVCIVEDNDDPGHEHAQAVARSIHGVAAEVRVLELPGLGPRLPKHGKDVSDWLDAGHTVDELAKLAFDAPVFDADAAPASSFTAPEHWKWYDLADLSEWEVEPLEPVIEGIVAKGNLVFEVAETQTGKSLVGAYVARVLVTGGKLFGRYAVTPVERVLYIVLEDPARRFHDRLMDMAHEFPPVERGRCKFLVAPGYRIDDDEMFLWLEDVIRGKGDGDAVVIIDTYQKATPGITSFDDEKQSLILHRLANMTRRLGVTLIVKDHFRKQAGGQRRRGEMSIDDIKGTGGKAQNADCVILMERTADRKQIKFQAFSKDFDEPVRILLNVTPKGSTEPKFSYAGDLERLGASSRERGETTRKRILASMKPNEWYSSTDLARALNINERTIRRHLQQLNESGHLADNDAKGKALRYWSTGESGQSNPGTKSPECPEP